MEITFPAATSRRQSATRESASSHSQDGIEPVPMAARWWNSVRTQPGHRTVAVTPVPRTSLARLSV